MSKEKCVLIEVRLVLQGRAEVAHGHGNGVSQRIGVTTLAVPSGGSQALDGEPAAGSLKSRVKPLDAGMDFPGNGHPSKAPELTQCPTSAFCWPGFAVA